MNPILYLIRDLWGLAGLVALTAILTEFGLSLWRWRRRRTDSRVDCDGYADRDWLAAHLAECDTLTFDWQPYVGYRHRPLRGRTLTIGADGRRRTWQPDHRSAGPLRIWVFGGSTVFGVGARDDFTIPSILAEALAARGVAAAVENRGVISYVMAQEAIALSEALKRGERPDVAIFYDGVNDVICALQSGRAGWPYRADKRAEEFMLLNRPRELARATLAATFPRLTKRLVRRASPPASGPSDRLADDVVEFYAGTVRQLKALADAYGIRLFAVWQPTLYSKTQQSPYEARICAGFAPESRRLFAEVYERRRKHPYLSTLPEALDLSDVVRDHRETLFLDPFHLTEGGNTGVVEALMPRILEATRRKLMRSEDDSGDRLGHTPPP